MAPAARTALPAQRQGAARSYADQHADGHPPTSLRAFNVAARCYDAARKVSVTSPRSVVRQDIAARLQGAGYVGHPPDTQ